MGRRAGSRASTQHPHARLAALPRWEGRPWPCPNPAGVSAPTLPWIPRCSASAWMFLAISWAVPVWEAYSTTSCLAGGALAGAGLAARCARSRARMAAPPVAGGGPAAATGGVAAEEGAAGLAASGCAAAVPLAAAEAGAGAAVLPLAAAGAGEAAAAVARWARRRARMAAPPAAGGGAASVCTHAARVGACE